MNYCIAFRAQEFLDALRVAMLFADKDDYSQAVNCIYIGKGPEDGSSYKMVAMNGKNMFLCDMEVPAMQEGEPLQALPYGPDYRDDLSPKDWRTEQYFLIPLKEAKALDRIMPKKLTGKEWIFFDIETRKEEAGGGYKVTATVLDTGYSFSERNHSMYDYRYLFKGFENWSDMQERPVFSVKTIELVAKAFKSTENVRVVLSETKSCFLIEDPDGSCPYKILTATFAESSYSERNAEDDTGSKAEAIAEAI